MSIWVDQNEQQPEHLQDVLVYFIPYPSTDSPNPFWCMSIAQFIKRRSVLAEGFMDEDVDNSYLDYDKENDKYWTPEGYYESNHLLEKQVHIVRENMYWMSLPDPPEKS